MPCRFQCIYATDHSTPLHTIQLFVLCCCLHLSPVPQYTFLALVRSGVMGCPSLWPRGVQCITDLAMLSVLTLTLLTSNHKTQNNEKKKLFTWTVGSWRKDKTFSYRRETALQGALVLAKSGRLELGETIFYGHYRSIFNHCDIIGLKAIEFGEKTQYKGYYAVQGHRGRYTNRKPPLVA